jgi:hypothetical protein
MRYYKALKNVGEGRLDPAASGNGAMTSPASLDGCASGHGAYTAQRWARHAADEHEPQQTVLSKSRHHYPMDWWLQHRSLWVG